MHKEHLKMRITLVVGFVLVGLTGVQSAATTASTVGKNK